MNDMAVKSDYTPEDLLTMPDGYRYELVDGILVERHMGWKAGVIASELLLRIGAFNLQHRQGWVNQGGDGSYQLFPGKRLVRKPDVSFVRFGRFPGGILPTGHALLAPDLAVEVVSPNDLFEEVAVKVEEYRRAGVRLIWVVSPQTHLVWVYRLDGSSAVVREDGDLDGEDVLPGFRCPVVELFPPDPDNGDASAA
jgi:Uma2 family endonuclease